MHNELKQLISQAMSQRAELEQKLIERAWSDETFKQELINNPKTVINRESGQQLSETLEIEVLQESASKAYFVLPQNPVQASDQELSEADLETVAGGANICLFGVTSITQCFNNSKTENAADLV